MSNEDDPFVRPSNSEFGHPEDSLPDDFLIEIDKELAVLDLEPLESEVQFQLVDPAPEPADGLSSDPGLRQMQETFLEISRNTLAPIGRYMKALSSGECFREVLELSEMIVTPMLPKTEQVGLSKYADDLTFFRSLLHLALGERDQVGMDAIREVVMEGYSTLSKRFGLRYRGYRLAVRNLVQFYRGLRQSDGVSEADIRKFFAIGVPSLTWIRRTKTSEMANLSGIETNVIVEIRKLAYTYRASIPVSGASLAKEESFIPTIEEPALQEDVATVDVTDTSVHEAEVKTSSRGQA